MSRHNDKSDLQKEIGRRFKEAVKAARITARDIADFLGLSNERSVSQWYRGEREIRPSFLALLSEKFKLNPVYILTGRGSPLLSGFELRNIKKKFFIEEEKALRKRYPYLIAVLENVFEAWKIIPKAALSDLDIALEQARNIGKKEGSFDKILSFVKKIFKKPKKAVKMVYSFLLEMPSHVLFFWANPYWKHCVLALWRLYWALALDIEPLSQDLATVGALYYREDDFFEAAKKLTRELEKNWSCDEEKIRKEKFPFESDQIEEPETLRFLRFAAMDLIDLYVKDELPSVCLVHHKVHWAGCPVCEGKEKEK